MLHVNISPKKEQGFIVVKVFGKNIIKKGKRKMKRMIINLVIEGNDEDLHQIKGAILSTASEALVSCKTEVLENARKEINFIDTDIARRNALKKELNKIYGAMSHCEF